MCCGKKRQLARTTTSQSSPVRPSPMPVAPFTPAFMYRGHSEMVVIGPVSRRIYRFSGPGARVEVDPRDRAFLGSLLIFAG